MTTTTTSPGATATPGPWSWEIHDPSMASLSGPDAERDHVLSVSPCKSCQAGREDWTWGRCMVPSEADADLIAAAPAIRDALEDLAAAAADVLSYRVEGSTRGDLKDTDASRKALTRLAAALSTTRTTLAGIGGKSEVPA